MQQITYLPTIEKITVESYPYGRLRTNAFFSLEFSEKKGFRSVFQTIDPKNGRLNAPKKSTYSDIIIMFKEAETGHIKHRHFDLNGCENINKAAEFLAENYNLFTGQQIEYIYLKMIAMIKVSMYAMRVYCNSQPEAMKPFFADVIRVMAEGAKTKENLFSKIKIDIEGLEGTKEQGYNPFIVKTYEIA